MRANIFLREKPVKLLLSLREASTRWHVSSLAKASGASYVHTVGLLHKLAEDGLVVFENENKFKFVKLTEQGLQIANMLGDVFIKFKKEKKEAAEPKPEQPPPLPAQETKTTEEAKKELLPTN